jgi:hypothetical protein
VQKQVENVMKIGDIYSASTQISTPGTAAEAQSAGRSRDDLSVRKHLSDRSELSQIAALVSDTDSHIAARAARLGQLRADFAAGRYEPDSARIGAALIQAAIDAGEADK